MYTNIYNNLYENSNSNEHNNENNENNENNDNNSNSSIDKKYMEPTILENINLDKYFSKEDIEKSIKNNKKLMITDKGLYSISKHMDAYWITQNIIEFIKSKGLNTYDLNIIDGTAGIGGNTISFSKYFAKIYAIEINNVHFNVLNNNLNALSILNVNTYFDNFLNIINDLNLKEIKSNIFFFDPPWGGKSYKNFKYFNLKIGKLSLYNIINILYEKKFKYVILKAPYNLNLSPIFNLIKYENMSVQSNFRKNMILCIFY